MFLAVSQSVESTVVSFMFVSSSIDPYALDPRRRMGRVGPAGGAAGNAEGASGWGPRKGD